MYKNQLFVISTVSVAIEGSMGDEKSKQDGIPPGASFGMTDYILEKV